RTVIQFESCICEHLLPHERNSRRVFAWPTKRQCSSSNKVLATIHQALLTAINLRGIPLFHIAYTIEGAGLRPHEVTFIIATKDNRTESLMFTREEIAVSAQRIDSFADA